MSSRVDRKAAARAARSADAARRGSRRQALIRLCVLAGIAAAVVATTVLLGARADTPPAERAGDSAARFAGIPQDGIGLGSPDAPATLVEFADLQCPYCGAYAREVLPTVVDRYVRPGRLRLELRLRAFLGEDSLRGAAVAAAAGRQDRLWPFVDAFYRNQGPENSGYVTDRFLRKLAGAIPGLDTRRAFADRSSPAARRSLMSAERLATRLGSNSTPAFYLRRGDGSLEALTPSALTSDAFTTALDGALAR